MTPQKRKGRPLVLLKSLILAITCLSFLGLLSCNNSGTGSTTSASGGSGTGTGWTITIQKFTNKVSISKEETSLINMRIADSMGSPAPINTRVCIAVSFGFIWFDGIETSTRTGCLSTSNNRGELIGTYFPPAVTGTDYIQVSSMGAIGSTTIEVVP
jgi:hypothetical protein